MPKPVRSSAWTRLVTDRVGVTDRGVTVTRAPVTTQSGGFYSASYDNTY